MDPAPQPWCGSTVLHWENGLVQITPAWGVPQAMGCRVGTPQCGTEQAWQGPGGAGRDGAPNPRSAAAAASCGHTEGCSHF